MSVFNELCFSLKPFEVYINEDTLIDDFIDFVVSKKVSICGNLNIGFCFCTEKKRIALSIKTELYKLFVSTVF